MTTEVTSETAVEPKSSNGVAKAAAKPKHKAAPRKPAKAAKQKTKAKPAKPSADALEMPRAEPREIQQMFRVTETEDKALRRAAIKMGCTSMTEFFRRKCGLPK